MRASRYSILRTQEPAPVVSSSSSQKVPAGRRRGPAFFNPSPPLPPLLYSGGQKTFSVFENIFISDCQLPDNRPVVYLYTLLSPFQLFYLVFFSTLSSVRVTQDVIEPHSLPRLYIDAAQAHLIHITFSRELLWLIIC